MVKYTLLRKPAMSSWPTLPRQLKLALGLGFFVILTCALIFYKSRATRLSKICEIQKSLDDIFDLEMKYMSKDPRPDENEWLPINDLDGHVYSAYLDVRPEVIDSYKHPAKEITWGLIRIIAILPTDIDVKKVDCIFKYDNKYHIYKRRRATSVKPMKENWDLKYSAFFVICDLVVLEDLNYELIYNEKQIPESVAIARYNNKEVTLNMSFIDISYPIMGMTQLNQLADKFMAFCVPVLHHSFNRPLDLIEFVEYYLLLGASHFTFYNSSVSAEVDSVLQYYVNRDLATVLTWKLPQHYVFERTLRADGLFAGLNDCLYRNSFYESYDYVANFGTDEFLVPRIHENLPQLMEYLDPTVENNEIKHITQNVLFLFRNAFFYTMYDDSTDKQANVPYLYTEGKTWRVEEIQKIGDRSRYIVRGRDVVELGNYDVPELRATSGMFARDLGTVAVEPEVALSHHYAPCEAEETGCYLKAIVIDKTAHRFTKKLRPRVAQACRIIFGTIGCPFVSKQPLA